MRPTFHYRLARRIHVAVHGAERPSDEEWTAYLDDIGARLPQIDGLYVVTPGGDLSNDQRRRSVEFWRHAERQPRIAVVTSSRLVVRVSGALRWFMPSQIKTFLPAQTDAAFAYLALDEPQRRAVLRAVEELGQLAAGRAAPSP
ncbi:MAG: STAS/SEC14 domain-containing protein [Sandaracinaceae bacterium]|nr:STAS/SEC14 domain-containing protein [Sandaracinaceae bacterium]